MRNPLKKITKKINFRLASNAEKHSHSKKSIPPEKEDQSSSSSYHVQDHSRRSGSSRDLGGSSSNNNHHGKSYYNSRRYDDSNRSLSQTEVEHDDPLFNNRSSRLRLALAESKKNGGNSTGNSAGNPSRSSAAAAATTMEYNHVAVSPKRKKKTGSAALRLGFGSRKTNPEETDAETHHHYYNQQQQQQQHSAQTPSRADRSSLNHHHHHPTTTPPRRTSASAHFASPTVSSQQKIREKADQSHLHHNHGHHHPSSNGTKPPLSSPTSNRGLNNNNNNKSNHPQQPPVGTIDPHLERIAKAAASLDNTGNELFERGEYDKAMAHYVKALRLKNRTLAGATAAPDTAQVVDELGNPTGAVPIPSARQSTRSTCTANGNSPDAPPNLPPQVPPPTTAAASGSDDLWISVATSINNIGYLRQQSGQASADETMQAYQNSLHIKRRVLGKDNLSCGKTLNNLGTVHYLKREYDQALAAYREALDIMVNTLGPLHLDVGTVHSNMGDVYWAQSGDKKYNSSSSNNNNKTKNHDPHRVYQISRNLALRHYRQSLEIRWEELHDHHDPKVIRLLEKIAALEMGESFLALVANNHKHRQSSNKDGTIPEEEELSDSDDPDDVEAKGNHRELQTLHQEVQADVKNMDMVERKMAIDMVKDKLRMIREMKKLSHLNVEIDELSMTSAARTPKVQPLSPVQRDEALGHVRERLQQLRHSRAHRQPPNVTRRHTVAVPPTSDLLEADCSPTNDFLSDRASQILNRTLLQPTESTDANEIAVPNRNNRSSNEDEFTFYNVWADHDIDNVSHDGSEISDITRSSLSVSRRTTATLNSGISALRQQPIPMHSVHTRNPWFIASAMTTTLPVSPGKQQKLPQPTDTTICTPETTSSPATPPLPPLPPPPMGSMTAL